MLLWPLAALCGTLLAFHLSEFLLAVLFMRDTLSWRSLLLSVPYATAMGCGVLEYTVEAAVLPATKAAAAVPAATAGAALVLAGELLRKAAMLTGRSAFTHDIQRTRRPNHQLVTHGVYRLMRHPGYAGWLLWAIGTQLLLANPLCAAGFAVVAWRFFRSRVAYEEWTLRQLFGHEYERYASITPSGLPGIP